MASRFLIFFLKKISRFKVFLVWQQTAFLTTSVSLSVYTIGGVPVLAVGGLAIWISLKLGFSIWDWWSTSEALEALSSSEVVEAVTSSEVVEAVTSSETSVEKPIEIVTSSEVVEAVSSFEVVEAVTSSEVVEAVTSSETSVEKLIEVGKAEREDMPLTWPQFILKWTCLIIIKCLKSFH